MSTAVLPSPVAPLKALIARQRPPSPSRPSEDGVFDLRWARDGRALRKYGMGVPNRADPHIIWLRIGTYGIYR